jgi:hypothetical protein
MEKKTETTTARRLRKALLYSATSFGVCIAILLGYIAFHPRSAPGDWLGYAFIGSIAATLISGIARFSHVLFAELQAPLSELLITFIFAGGVMAATSPLLKDSFDADPTVRTLVWMLIITVSALLGSIWGWSAMKRLEERNARRRLKLLLCGWFGIVGMAGAAVFALMTLFLIAGWVAGDRMSFNSGLIEFIAANLAAAPLAIPAFLVERRIRRNLSEHAAEIPVDVNLEAAGPASSAAPSGVQAQ